MAEHMMHRSAVLVAAWLLITLVSSSQADRLNNYILHSNMSNNSQEPCFDISGKQVQPGETYVPGPDYCTVCKCDGGVDRFCRAMLCQPRQDCRSFRVGATCCDFICLDDVILPRPGGGDHYMEENSLGVRLAAAILTALMSFVLLLFLVHRLRQRRIAAQQYVNARDSACCHSSVYWHSSDEAQLFPQVVLSPWKPPSCTMDAPPPYTEADAQRAQLVAAAAAGANAHTQGSYPFAASTGQRGNQVLPSYAPPSYSSGGTNAVVAAYTAGRHGAGETDTEQALCLNAQEQETTAGHSRDLNNGILANLGPLAVQLLPTGPNTTDLREQIQRQRQNLTDHTTRTLPRLSAANNNISSSDDQESLSQVLDNDSKHACLSDLHTLPRVTSPTIATTESPPEALYDDNSCASGIRPDNKSNEHHSTNTEIVSLNDASRNGENHTNDASYSNSACGEVCPNDYIKNESAENFDHMNSSHKSIVRQSVLKFEAAAAADALSLRSNSPAATSAANESPQHLAEVALERRWGHHPDNSHNLRQHAPFHQRRGTPRDEHGVGCRFPQKPRSSDSTTPVARQQQHGYTNYMHNSQQRLHLQPPPHIMQAPPCYEESHLDQRIMLGPPYYSSSQEQTVANQKSHHRNNLSQNGSHPVQLPPMHLHQEHFTPQRHDRNLHTKPQQQQQQQHSIRSPPDTSSSSNRPPHNRLVYHRKKSSSQWDGGVEISDEQDRLWLHTTSGLRHAESSSGDGCLLNVSPDDPPDPIIPKPLTQHNVTEQNQSSGGTNTTNCAAAPHKVVGHSRKKCIGSVVKEVASSTDLYSGSERAVASGGGADACCSSGYSFEQTHQDDAAMLEEQENLVTYSINDGAHPN